MTLSNKVREFNEEIVPIARKIVHGDETTMVMTDGGPVRSMANLIKTKGDEFDANFASTFAVFDEVRETAQSASLDATAARNAAKLSADAALIQAGVYATEAQGRAAVADGVAFKVQGSGDVAAYEYRRVGAAIVSTLIGSYPSAVAVSTNTAGLSRTSDRATALEQVVQLAPTITLPILGACASVMVNDANVVLEAVTSTGVRYVAQGGSLVPLDLSGRAAIAPTIDVPGIGAASLVYVDEVTGAIIGGIGTGGTSFHVSGGRLAFVGGADSKVSIGYSAPVNAGYVYKTADDLVVDCWIVIGQSLGVGTNNDLSDSSVSTVPQHEGYAFTFGNGAYVGRPPNNYPIDSLGGLRERSFINGTAGFWESICSRFGWTLLDKMQAAIGARQKIFVCSSASNGRSFGQLSRGDASYGVFLDHMKAAQSLLTDAGYKPRLRGLLVMHGEADTSAGTIRSTYKKMLHTWRRWAEEDARTIFGAEQLSSTVEMYTYQTNRGGANYFAMPEIAAAQLDANEDNPHTTCVGPIYWATKAIGDGAHPNAVSYARIGEQFADAVFKHTYSGQSFQPLHITDSYWRDDTHIRVRYTAPVSVEANDALVTISTLGPGKGFDFFDGSMAPPIVTGVAVIATNEIEVTLSNASAGRTPRLYYACRRTAGEAYRVDGHRGGVRTATAFMNSEVTGTPNYHWAAQQVINIGEMK